MDVPGLGNGLRTESCLFVCITGQPIAPYSLLDTADPEHAGHLFQVSS